MFSSALACSVGFVEASGALSPQSWRALRAVAAASCGQVWSGGGCNAAASTRAAFTAPCLVQ